MIVVVAVLLFCSVCSSVVDRIVSLLSSFLAHHIIITHYHLPRLLLFTQTLNRGKT